MAAPPDKMDSIGAPRLAASRLALLRGGRLLLTGIDFALGPGEVLMLTGPNGVGKSSLLRLIAGLLPPFAGELRVDGAVGLLDDRLALDVDLPLGGALGFWGAIDGADSRAMQAAMADFDLLDLDRVPVRMLSTGQRKRAALARLVASRAPIWLLDEPASGLDRSSLDCLLVRTRAHLADGGIAIIVSHQPLAIERAAELDLAAHRPKETV